MAKPPTCFVIQVFDNNGPFDRRFKESIKPAIDKAGVESQRADQILGLQPIITKIEQSIREASICLADVSIDNANVWLELGYALALNRPCIILCDKSQRERLPFDIQHRPVIMYRTDSKGDFEDLEERITREIKNQLEKAQLIESSPVLKQGVSIPNDLHNPEVSILSALLAVYPTPSGTASPRELGERVWELGINETQFGLGITKLEAKGLIIVNHDIEDDNWGNTVHSKYYKISPEGIQWMHEHADLLEAPDKTSSVDEDIPF